MNVYRYSVKAPSGETVEATIQAVSRYEALASLHAQQVTVIELEEAAPSAVESKARKRNASARTGFARVPRIAVTEQAMFCRQLSISVSSGISLRESLEAIGLDMDNPAFARILRGINDKLDNGKMFSQSISGLEKVFSRLFVAMVRAAEEAGTMAPTLNYLADSIEKADRLTRKIRSITAYPVFIAVFFCVVSFILTIFVLPKFQAIFTSFNAPLPALTLVVFGVNNFILKHAVVLGAAVFLLVAGLTSYGRSRPGQAQFDRLVLHTPFFGPLLRKLAVARFCRNFAMLVRGGVPVATAMEITAETLANKAMEESLLASRQRIVAGSAISASLDPDYFPRLLIRMVNVGESSGRLPEVLERVSSVYEDQAEGSIMMATAMFEPVIICVFGSLILTLVLSIYMPVFSLASSMNRL